MTETNVMQQEDEVPPCLADLTIGAMGNPKNSLMTYHDSKFARGSVRSFRQKMLNAHRFELTSELIHAVTLVASSLDLPTLSVMIENARPCFNNMWIEWDEQVRREASLAIQRKVYGREVNAPPSGEFVDRQGYLIQRMNEDQKAGPLGSHAWGPEGGNLNRTEQGRRHGGPLRKLQTSYPVHPTFPDSAFFYTGVSFSERFNKRVSVAPVGYVLSNETSLTSDRATLKWLTGLVKEEDLDKYIERERPENRLNAQDEEFSDDDSFQYDAFLSVLNYEWVTIALMNGVSEAPPKGWFRKKGNFDSFWQGRSQYPVKKSARFRKNESQLFQMKDKFWSFASQPMDWSISFKEGFRTASPHDDLMLIADDLRFIVTAMAMLNFTWISADPAQRSDQKKIVNGKVLPRNEYRRLRIGLPPKEMEKKIRGVLSGRMPSRQHDVRGHFRKMSSGKRIWIHAHVRGDPSLGIIRKEYVLDKETEDRR